MAYRVEISYRAERDIEDIVRYLHQHSPRAATRWHAGILEAVHTLEELPERAGLAPESEELGIELRQLLYGKRRNVYRILFTIEGDTVNIVRVRHSAQDLLKPYEL